MRFLFVNKIQAMTSTTIHGSVHFNTQEPWRYSDTTGRENISVSVISEAIGQLVSWLSLRNTDFAGRPVFLFARSIELSAGVPVGASVDLQAEISNESSDSFVFSGRAIFAGKTVASIEDCGGYLMPLAELEDPEVTKTRFKDLCSTGIPLNPASAAFDFSTLVDGISELEVGAKITTNKTFQGSMPFYADHFPRFPVTPIVLINEMIGRATAVMMGGENAPMMIIPQAVQDLKIKSFIKPGDVAHVSVKKIEDDGVNFETIAEIMLSGKRILRGRYRYQRSPV